MNFEAAALSAYSKKILTAGLIIASTLLSQQVLAEEEPTPNYTIEVIVFENHALKGWTEELWPNEIELPETHNSVSLTSRGQAPLWVTPQNNKLDDVVDRMRRDFTILFHKSWSQNTLLADTTPLVLMEGGKPGRTNLLGTLKLYKTRFAHVQFDLEVEKQIPEKVTEAFASNQQVAIEDLPSHWRFKLKEKRKIKPGELHYIDHPLFGVIVQIQKNN